MIEWIILVYHIGNMDVPVIRQLHRYPTEEQCNVDKEKMEKALPKGDYITVCQKVEKEV